MDPLVSIIMPVYNAEKFVQETLKSCISQTYRKIEIIVVNDGSRDNSEEIIRKFKDPRLKYHAIENSGPCYARNYGIARAKGELFQFLDADDVLHPQKIESQMRFYKQHGDSHIYSGVMGIISNGRKSLERDFDFYYKNLDKEEYFREMFGHFGKYFTTGIWLVPKELLSSTHGWDQKVLINNDGEYFSRLILNSAGIIFCPGAVFYYRKDVPESLSKNFNSRKIYESWLYSYTCYVDAFKKNLDAAAAKELGRKALSVYYCNSYPHYPELRAACKQQIQALGYRSAAPHGGKVFKMLSGWFGTDTGLQIRTLKNKGRSFIKRVRNDRMLPKKSLKTAESV